MRLLFPDVLDQVPVVFADSSALIGISHLPLAGIDPAYPLSSVTVSASASSRLIAAANKIVTNEPADSVLPGHGILLVTALRLLSNLVAHHISGSWLPNDSDWMAARALVGKGRAEATLSSEESFPHVSAITLKDESTFRLTSTIDGFLAVSA